MSEFMPISRELPAYELEAQLEQLLLEETFETKDEKCRVVTFNEASSDVPELLQNVSAVRVGRVIPEGGAPPSYYIELYSFSDSRNSGVIKKYAYDQGNLYKEVHEFEDMIRFDELLKQGVITGRDFQERLHELLTEYEEIELNSEEKERELTVLVEVIGYLQESV